MSLKSKLVEHRASVMAGVALSTFVGLLLLKSHMVGDGFMALSYDLPFRFAPRVSLDNVVMLMLDEVAYREMGQKYGQGWDRRLHAELLRRLQSDGARLVVFDVFLADETSREEDQAFIEAIRDFKSVVLAADPKPASYKRFTIPAGYREGDPIPPAAPLLEVVGDQWGIGAVFRDLDFVVRQHLMEPKIPDRSTLAWAAARVYGAEVTRDSTQRDIERWIRYYPPLGSIPALSYSHYKVQPPGFFKDKIVFVGGSPASQFSSDRPAERMGRHDDAFLTPLNRWSGTITPGVEIIATTFLNLVHQDWIKQIHYIPEFLAVLLAGVIFGGGLALLRPVPGAVVAILSSLAVAACGILIFWVFRTWFGWAVIAAGQIPVAWLSSAVLHSRTLIREKEALKAQLETVKSLRDVLRHASTNTPRSPLGQMQAVNDLPTIVDKPVVRDFDLLQRIGEGAYGEVWLACSLTGACRAIKIVYRRNFSDQRPFDREFEGVRNFEPISRTHPGWVSILHVGKDESAGFFYYVMEPADDLVRGAEIEPAEYTPKTLSKVLVEVPWLPVADCADLGAKLADALAALHKLGLIHRDVKPSNIIFVNDAPKLADIGLVARAEESESFVGTEGFIPPEGPGTPLADVFSLGRVLYQASTGCEPSRHPGLPTALGDRSDARDLMRLMDVINRACANVREERYQSAADLRDDLVKLRASLCRKAK